MPVPENHHHWWLTTHQAGVLHAVPAEAVPVDDETALEALTADSPTLTARCNETFTAVWPGLVSRYGRPRCRPCCAAVGIPPGQGVPANTPAPKEGN